MLSRGRGRCEIDRNRSGPNAHASGRVEELAQKSTEGVLTPDERDEYAEISSTERHAESPQAPDGGTLDGACSVVKVSRDVRELVVRRA